MTCESALELLLDAEPSEFCARERTPLGDHLRDCARCRRVAAQLLRDTRGLALAMNAVPVRRSNRVGRLTMVPGFAMATLLVAVLLSTPDTAAVAPSVMEPVTAVVTLPVTTESAPSAAVPPAARRYATRDVMRQGREFARAVPLAPVRLAPSRAREVPLSVESSGVTVTPEAGTRATVMHTSNPKLVVVWLY